MRKDKLSLCLMLITLALILQTSPVFAGDDKRDHPSISGLETGIYLIFTVNLEQIMSLQKPKFHTEVSVFRTTWTMDEIKSCWMTGMKYCLKDHTEDYVDKFIRFYNIRNKNRREDFYLQLTDTKVEESLQRELQRGRDRRSERAEDQSPTDGGMVLKTQVFLTKIPPVSRR
jgi:hypothetical protein